LNASILQLGEGGKISVKFSYRLALAISAKIVLDYHRHSTLAPD